MLKTTVICSLQFEAIHNWPGVIDAHPEVAQTVSFLQHPHRHMFHIKAWKAVTHADRDVEIIVLKRQILQHLKAKYPTGQLGSTSCEMLALDLVERFGLDACEVLEDGENGALVSTIQHKEEV